MLSYKNRIVFTGGSGRFASAFKSVEKQSKYKFFFPKKIELNILKIETIKRYLKSKKPKYLIHLAGLSRPMNIHQKDIKQIINSQDYVLQSRIADLEGQNTTYLIAIGIIIFILF